jgi:hypothetical protein
MAGTGPSTTAGQSGELGRVVGWISDAYEDVQNARRDFDFLRNEFSFNCVAATSSYPASTVTNLANWKKDSITCYLNTTVDEQYISYVAWDVFRDSRLRGSSGTVAGRPIEFSIKPDKSIVLWPIPDNTYTIDGEYYRNAHVMTADADVPLFNRFHMAIVYNALMRAATWLQDPAMYASAQREYGRLLNKIDADNTPTISAGRPLA